MYIYADILIITNIYANYFLLKATAKLTHTALRNGKCILGALVGSLFSLIILLPEVNPFILLLLRIISAILVIAVAFSGKDLQTLYKIGLVFFFVSFMFAGIEYAVSLIGGSGMLWHNSVLYINISLLTLLISTIISYIILCLLRKILDGSSNFDGDYTIIIIHGCKQTAIKAACDSCNNLTDSFSGKPVIICSKSSVEPLFDKSVLENAIAGCSASDNSEPQKHIKGWRVVPYSTVDSEGLMPSFLPTGIYIKNNENGKIKYIDAYIGVVEKDMDHAVFNPKILAAG